MKAAILESYSKQHPSLVVMDWDKPNENEMEDNEVILKVLTCGVNPVDYIIAEGKLKFLFDYALPTIAGNEVVGIVESKGTV